MTVRGNDQLHFMDKKTEAQMAKTDFGALLRSQWPIQDLNPSPPQPPWSLRVGASQLEEPRGLSWDSPPALLCPASPAPAVGEPTALRGGEGWLFPAWYLRAGQGVGCGLARGLCVPKRVWPSAAETEAGGQGFLSKPSRLAKAWQATPSPKR